MTDRQVVTPRVLKVLSSDFVTMSEAAQMVLRPKMTLYRWAKNGKLITVSIGGIQLVPTSEVERLKRLLAKKEGADSVE